MTGGGSGLPLLRGLGFSGYRSLSSPDLLIGPLTKVNVIAGQNNAGKSNLLRAAQTFLGGANRAMGRWTLPELPSGLDLPHGWGSRAPEVLVGVEATAEAIQQLAESAGARFEASRSPGRAWPEQLLEVLNTDAFRLTPPHNVLWFRYEITKPPNHSGAPRFDFTLSQSQLEQALKGIDRGSVSRLASAVSSTTGGRPTDDLQRVVTAIFPLAAVPQVATIDAIRQVRPGDSDGVLVAHDGTGLIERLQRLENPSAATLTQDRARFDRINDFVAGVLNDPSVKLTIPHDRSTITVVRDGIALPIEHLGTGTQELIILAAAGSLLEDHLVCVEEPELHLHPMAQRTLMRYLAENTSNQYLIATHSAHLLDTERASVYHVRASTDGTEVKHVGTPTEQHDVCADLGYRPSDLVQANAIIWVEGPSDRIYLRHWITSIAPDLIEGTNYSIMFYGGRLLSHLTAHDPEVDDFISLRRINRHLCILIDSDKPKPRARINATKTRVRNEFDHGPGHAWVTDGYTIENYIPPEILRQALREVHPRYAFTPPSDQWQNPLPTRGKITPDKVAIARHVANVWGPEAWAADRRLTRHIRRVVRFIRGANEPLVSGARARHMDDDVG